MARKISKTKHKNGSGVALGKQKQKQSQKVIVNITQPKRVYSKSLKGKEETKSFIPLMPSFNINPAQPQPLSDLAKVLGMLIPKAQTESTLGSAIPVKVEIPKTQKPVDIGGLKNSKEQPTLGEAIESAEIPLEIKTRRNKQQMEEARQMGREDINSIQLGLSRFNFAPRTETSDLMSEVSTTPLYEGGREVPEPKVKRQYVKSGKYSKKQPKEFSEFQKE